jgi:hypothetical protein
MRLAGWGLVIGLVSAGCGPPTSPSSGVIDGVYTLRFETTCAALPAEIRSREYLASIEGGTVSLSGGTFWMHPSRGLMNRFALGPAGDRVGLRFDSLTSSNLPTLVEETAPGVYFGIVGTGAGDLHTDRAGDVTMSGTLSAGFGWGPNLADDRLHAGCGSGTHQATFRFTRTTATFVPPGVAPTPISLRVSGPASVAPQESAQFEAIAQYPDGSTADVTLDSNWHRGVSFAIDVGAEGLVTGRFIGESTVAASLPIANTSPLGDSREVIVVPPGTFRIAGQVTTGSPAQPVVNAVIAVISGQATGQSAATDWEGRYALYGVAGESQIRGTRDGYDPQIMSVAGSSHQTVNFHLRQQSPFPDVSGTYTLTLTADSACANPIPPPHDVRTYTATIRQNGRVLDVVLGGAPFFVVEGRGNGFPGLVDPLQLSFQLDDNHHFELGSNPDVVEQLGGASVMMLLGALTTAIAPSRLAGEFSGTFQPADRALPSNGFFWGPPCQSSRHQAVFSR